MVERRERTDDAHDCIGHVAVVVRNVRKVLHLAHHVVAEVPHDTALQRGQFREQRGAVQLEEGLDGSEHPLVEGHRVRQVALHGEMPATGDERRTRAATDEREAAPPLAVLNGLEEEPGLVTDELHVGGHRGLEVRKQFDPDGDHCELCRQRAELLA